MSIEPQRWSHEERLALACEITERTKQVHASQLKAIGIYGSTASGTDGSFSDLEMLCVLRVAALTTRMSVGLSLTGLSPS